jgi:2-methylcitrate dehydratase PrpD
MRTKDGKVYSAKVDLPKGHAANPMTNEEFEAKFRSCALSSGKDISLKVLDNLIDTLNNLEQVDDIRQVTRLFGLQER